jgi:hypothetical protein
MKKTQLSLLVILAVWLFAVPAHAIIVPKTTTAASPSIEQQKKDLKKEFKAQKRLAKMERILKRAIDFNDPVEKWMWFWIFGWGIAVVLSTFLWSSVVYLPGLFWAAGTVCLIIWIVKKFGS